MEQQFIFQRMNLDDPDRDLKPGEYRGANNLIPQRDGQSITPRRQNVPSFDEVVNQFLPQPAGVYRCIGQHYERTEGKLYYIVKGISDPTVNAIYEYDVFGEVIAIVIDNPAFDFDKDRYMTGITFENGTLIFTDGVQPTYAVNIEAAKSGMYTAGSPTSSVIKQRLEFTKTAPVLPPTAEKILTSSLTSSRINGDNWKFAYRYIFFDNAESTISPFSKMVQGRFLSNLSDIQKEIKVTIPDLNEVAEGFVKKIEVFAIKNDSQDLLKFGEIKDFTSPMEINFTNQEIRTLLDSAAATRYQNENPRIADTLEVCKSRTFMPQSTSGDNVDHSTYTLTAEAFLETPTFAPDPFSAFLRVAASGGSYRVGIAFHDLKMNRTLVGKTVTVNVPWVMTAQAQDQVTDANDWNYHIRINLAGTPPQGYTHYSFLVSKEQIYATYVDAPLNVFFPVGRKDTQSQVPQNSFEFRDFYYANAPSANFTGVLHLYMPLNLPFTPEAGMRIRFLTDMNGEINESKETFEILENAGDYLVINEPDDVDWTNAFVTNISGKYKAQLVCRIYELQEQPSELLYEIGEVYEVSNPEFSPEFTETQLVWKGDQFIVGRPNIQLPFDPATFNPLQYASSLSPLDGNKSQVEKESWFWQMNRFSVQQHPVCIAKTAVANVVVRRSETALPDQWGDSPVFIEKVELWDYSKKATDHGRPNTEGDDEQIENGSIILISEPYFQGTKINGLYNLQLESAFDEVDQEFGRIVKLLYVGQNLMLAIHERNVTSLYLSEAFIKQADDTDILTKIDRIIGQQRPQIRPYGTLNPESVIAHNGKAYWWDVSKGEIIRYDNNGMDTLGEVHRCKSLLNEIGRKLRKNTAESKVTMAYHSDYDVIFITFYPTTIPGEDDFAGLTLGLTDGGFIGFYSFVPEMWAKLPNRVTSFNSGRLYLSDGDNSFNTFYADHSQQDNSYMHVVANDKNIFEKVWESVGVNSNVAWALKQAYNSDQSTHLLTSDFYLRQRMRYADLLRDENTPNISAPKTPLIHGDPLQSQTLDLIFEYDGTDYAALEELFVGFQYLAGQHKAAFREEKRKAQQ